MKKNEWATVRISDMNSLGYGLGHVDGKVVFVSDTVPGEEWKVRIIKDGGNYFVGRKEELLCPSKMRIPSACTAFPQCGGCSFCHIGYAEELKLKREFVKGFLRKEGLAELSVLPVLSTGKTAGYRNKIQYPYRDGQLGYYAAHSHRIVPNRGCLLHPPKAEALLADAARFFKENRVEGYDEERGKGLLRHVYLRTNGDGSEMLLTLVVNGEEFPLGQELAEELKKRHPGFTGLLLNVNQEKNNVILGKTFRLLWGKGVLTDRLLSCDFEMSPASFYQVNREGAELLYKEVQKRADLREGQKVVDLFCGIGTIGLCLCKDVPGAELVGVEVVPEAVENAKKNALRNGIPNARFFLGDANHPAVNEADLVVVDPPRKGLEEELIESLSARAFRKIIYVSCDPATLARDLKRFQMRSWLLGDVQPVDMFPRTGHVETVVLLSRETINDHTIGNLNLSNNQQTVMETDAKRRIAGKFTDNRPMTDGLKTDALSKFRIYKEKLKCGFLGDSITEGINTTKTYHEYLAELCGIEARNFGANGSCISTYTLDASLHYYCMVERVETVDKDSDMVFVFGGTNDFNRGCPMGTFESKDKNTFKGALSVMLQYLKDHFPNKKIYLLTPIRRGIFDSQPTDLQANSIGLYLTDYVDAIKEAGELFDIEVIDLHTLTGLNPNNKECADQYFHNSGSIDNLHPNAKGHLVIAETICRHLLKA